jgi:hypothetical protein
MTYTADALVWLLVWSAVGVTGRVLIANGDAKRNARRQAQLDHRKAAR